MIEINYFTENSLASRAYIRRKILKDKSIPYCCQKCSLIDIWQNTKLTLDLDHINGIRNDHRLENLRFLCPNCHSQQLTTGRRKEKFKPVLNEQIIIDLAKNNKSIRQILLQLNLSDASANYQRIKYILEINNLDYKHNAEFETERTIDRHRPRFDMRKAIRPNKEDLEKLLWEKPMEIIAKDFGLSGQSIPRWVQDYQITNRPPKGYWRRRNLGYSHEQSLIPQTKRKILNAIKV